MSLSLYAAAAAVCMSINPSYISPLPAPHTDAPSDENVRLRVRAKRGAKEISNLRGGKF